MTEIEILRLISWFGLLVSGVSMLTAVIPISAANGGRWMLVGLAVAGFAMFVNAACLVVITRNITSIQSTGIAEVGVFVVRFTPSIVGAVFIAMGCHYWRIRHKGHLVSGSAVMTIPVTIQQDASIEVKE